MFKMSAPAVHDHVRGLLLKDELTSRLAAVIQAKLEEMGDDIKGVSWFSSGAASYAACKPQRAA